MTAYNNTTKGSKNILKYYEIKNKNNIKMYFYIYILIKTEIGP